MVRDNGWQYEKLDAALNTSIFPLPHIGLSVVPVSMSFEAVVVRAFLISLNVAAGFFCSNNAIQPATTGAAILVPCSIRYKPLTTIYGESASSPESDDKQETTACPLAVILGFTTLSLLGPIELKPEISS